MTAAKYQFGEFRVDCGRFELLLNGQSVRLERKPMELLILLLEGEGRLVTRAEIAAHLWSSEVFVDTEHGINTAIRKIRQALDDDPEDPRFVQTVTGKGYRFAAAIQLISPDPARVEAVPAAPPQTPRRVIAWYIAGGVCTVLLIASVAFYRSRPGPTTVTYTQLTDFTDSAVAPALSPDGRMVAFIRGSQPFLTGDQIYLMMLPSGEARRLTNDNRLKYGLAFSPDGSEVAYTVLVAPGFATYAVSVLGGDSHLLMTNSAGLVWLNQQQLLFSQIRSGIHLGVVTGTAARAGLREIYYPAHERAMVHYSFPSPDRHSAIVVEMNSNGGWAPCRLISLDTQSPPRSIGPNGGCTSAGWSPDGAWAYFTATVDEHSHLWRQRIPNGVPEQFTFGPTEEEGVAIEPTGRSLVTSIGVRQSALWIHDPGGDRQLSSEGEVVAGSSPPTFSQNDTVIYYLLRHGQEGPTAELWRTMLDSGKSEAVLPGTSILAYDISSDGKQVIYAIAASGGTTELWLAPVDRSSPPIKVGNRGATSPHFGANGNIFFQQTEGNENYLEQMSLDGSNISKVVPYAISEIQSWSPGRRWTAAIVPNPPEGKGPASMAIPLDGGPPRRICAGYCNPTWSTSGKLLFIPVEPASRISPGRSLAIPLGPGEAIPALPPGGIVPMSPPSAVKGAVSFPREFFIPGKDLDHFAYVNISAHRNLYRISLP